MLTVAPLEFRPTYPPTYPHIYPFTRSLFTRQISGCDLGALHVPVDLLAQHCGEEKQNTCAVRCLPVQELSPLFSTRSRHLTSGQVRRGGEGRLPRHPSLSIMDSDDATPLQSGHFSLNVVSVMFIGWEFVHTMPFEHFFEDYF